MRLVLAGGTFDLAARAAFREGREIPMSRRDWALLEYLAVRRRGRRS